MAKLKPADFIAAVAPVAVQLRLEGSPIFASLRIAQAAHETGWNIHSWNNLVGLKVGSGKPNQYWDGSSVRTGTWEVINGYRVDTTANWRAYRSIEDCFRDQDLLFQSSRYARVRAAKMPDEQADMLQACGYATDPQYAAKLKNIIFMYDLKRYDIQAEVEKRMIEELKSRVEQLAAENKQLKQRIERLEKRASMPVPEWAKEAIEAAVKAKLINAPDSGGYDFYRILTVMHRKGLI